MDEAEIAKREALRAIARRYHGGTVRPDGLRDAHRICDAQARGMLQIHVLPDGRWQIHATRRAGREKTAQRARGKP